MIENVQWKLSLSVRFSNHGLLDCLGRNTSEQSRLIKFASKTFFPPTFLCILWIKQIFCISRTRIFFPLHWDIVSLVYVCFGDLKVCSNLSDGVSDVEVCKIKNSPGKQTNKKIGCYEKQEWHHTSYLLTCNEIYHFLIYRQEKITC